MRDRVILLGMTYLGTGEQKVAFCVVPAQIRQNEVGHKDFSMVYSGAQYRAMFITSLVPEAYRVIVSGSASFSRQLTQSSSGGDYFKVLITAIGATQTLC